MLKSDTLTFLKKLKRPANNKKAWVDEHREACDAAKADVEDFAALMIKEAAKFDPRIARAGLRGKACVTRLNRDVRFHGGLPFKHDFYVVLNHRGKKKPTAFYYVHIEPGNCFAGGGVYNPDSRDLLKYRRGVSDDFARFKKIVSGAGFRKTFPAGVQTPEKAKTSPRGFDADDPAAEYLKFKGFFTREKLSDRDLTTTSSLKKIVKLWRGSKPLVDFLNDAFEGQASSASQRPGNPQYPA